MISNANANAIPYIKDDDIFKRHLIAAYSAKSKTNEDKDRNILKDLSGHDNDIILYNFNYKLNSGYGGYYVDCITGINRGCDNITSNSFHIINSTGGVVQKEIYCTSKFKCQVKVTNLGDNLIDNFKIIFAYHNPNSGWTTFSNIEGTFEINLINLNFIPDLLYFYIRDDQFIDITKSIDVLIEFLPNYPDSLVFDGDKSYGLCSNFPLLDDFTIIAKRIPDITIIGGPLLSKSTTINNGEFIFEIYRSNVEVNLWSYGRANNNVHVPNSNISYLTKNDYNTQTIYNGNGNKENALYLGNVRFNDKRFYKGVVYCIYIFDKSLTPNQIKKFVRKYIDKDYEL